MTKLIAALALALALPATALAQSPAPAPSPEAASAYADIKATLGFVPTFFKAFPEEGIAAAWDELKTVQLNPTDRAARQDQGADRPRGRRADPVPLLHLLPHAGRQAERRHRRGGARRRSRWPAITRHWSTVLNGMQIDVAEFKQEVDRGVRVRQAPATGTATRRSRSPTRRRRTRTCERTLGSVPTFLRRSPRRASPPAWREMKSIQLNPATALTGKTKELIGLAVAAQIPCQYCIYFHTEAAKLNGASDAEIREAVAMAAITRHWWTVLNGSLIDENQFRREVDQIVRNAKKAAAKAK